MQKLQKLQKLQPLETKKPLTSGQYSFKLDIFTKQIPNANSMGTRGICFLYCSHRNLL